MDIIDKLTEFTISQMEVIDYIIYINNKLTKEPYIPIITLCYFKRIFKLTNNIYELKMLIQGCIILAIKYHSDNVVYLSDFCRESGIDFEIMRKVEGRVLKSLEYRLGITDRELKNMINLLEKENRLVFSKTLSLYRPQEIEVES